MLEDSVLYVSGILARHVSVLLMSLPFPKFLADLQMLDLLREIRDNSPLPSLGKSRMSFMFEFPSLHLHVEIVCFAISCQCIDKVFASQPLNTDEWQQDIIFVTGSEDAEPFRADRSELLVPVV